MSKYGILNKLVIFTALEYIQKAVEEETTYEREFMLRILGQLKAYRVMHRFNQEEANMLTRLGEEPAMKAIREKEIDFGIYSLSLLTLWIERIPKKERPHLNISDAKIMKLKSNLIMDVLRLKQKNKDSYERVKEIVDDSKLVAKQFFAHVEESLVKD